MASTVVADQVRVAGAGRRGAAMVVDVVVVLVLMVGTQLAIDLTFDQSQKWLSPVILVAYFVGLPVTGLQGTLGKRGIGIKITDLAGNRIGAGRSLLRFAASLVSLAALGLGYALCFWNARRRTLHDFIAGTVVVDAKAAPAGIAAASPASMPRAQRVMKTVVFLALLWVPVWFYWDAMNARVAYTSNSANLQEAKRVVAAIDDYKRKNGRFPTELAALRPAHLAADPKMAGRATLYYASTPAGDGCWLAIVFWLRPGLFPSDDVNEYDCAAGQWKVKDFNELKAQPVEVSRPR